YIVDYRDLFNSLESAIKDYTGGALQGYEKTDVEGLLSDRVEKTRQDLDEGLEGIRALCEPVEPPKNTLQYQRYFCAAEPGDAEQLKANEPKRVELYKAVARLSRAYANLASEMEAAGYSNAEAAAIGAEVAHYVGVRDEVKLGAGENVDFKQYEAGMLRMLDAYISADPSEVVSDFGSASLIEMIVELGAGAIDKLPEGIRRDPEAVAETIANNIRTLIIDERPLNPKYYDRMSELLDTILEERRQESLDYRDYLGKLLGHAEKLGKEESETEYPAWADSGARRALVDFFGSDGEFAERIDGAVRLSKPDSWVGNPLKERVVKRAIRDALPPEFDRLDDLFELVRARDEYQ